MNKSIKLAKELVKIAKSLIADNNIDQYIENRLDEAESQNKKYILHHKQGNFWRIQACKNFSDVKKGDFGGFVKSEENLSHKGNCWIYDQARVFDNAKIFGNAKIFNNAWIYDNAIVSDKAIVADNAMVKKNAKVFNDAYIHDNAVILSNVCGNAQIGGGAMIDYNVKNQKIITFN